VVESSCTATPFTPSSSQLTRRVPPHTRHTNISLNVITHNYRLPSFRTLNIDPLQMNPITRRARTTRQIRHDIPCLPATRAMDIDELNIRNVNLARILRTSRIIDVEIALIQHNRCIRVLHKNVLIRDVINISVANIRASPSLETRAVLAIQERDVFHPGVGNIVFDAGILADGTHGYAMCAVAPEIFDEDVGCVGFGREAVVADVDAGICHGQPVDVKRVEAVGVFGKGLYSSTTCIIMIWESLLMH
jgi:hypothetical protein